jgi:hypothetical protein
MKSNQLNSLFNQLCLTLNIPNYNDIKDYSKKSLKLDYNAIYGGYRIDVVLTNTAEDFFSYSNRFSKKEMIAYIQGLLEGINQDYIKRLNK